MELRGAVVVVTGASSGIGEATAIAFAQRGSRVVLAARRIDRLETLASRIEAAGGSAVALRCDVTDTDELRKLPGVVEATLGATDVLVNNAGIPGGGAFEELSHAQIDDVLDVNLGGVVHATRAFLPGMLARGRGHVINVASLAGRFAAPGAAVYTATKHAVVAFGESLALSTAPRGVQVTSVLPGFIPTETFSGEGPGPLKTTSEAVATAIVGAVRSGRGGEVFLPRWPRPFEAFRVLAPGLYHGLIRAAVRR